MLGAIGFFLASKHAAFCRGVYRVWQGAWCCGSTLLVPNPEGKVDAFLIRVDTQEDGSDDVRSARGGFQTLEAGESEAGMGATVIGGSVSDSSGSEAWTETIATGGSEAGTGTSATGVSAAATTVTLAAARPTSSGSGETLPGSAAVATSPAGATDIMFLGFASSSIPPRPCSTR